LERVKEYTTDIEREPPEFIEPRPAASWPSSGAIFCQNLVVRYAVSRFTFEHLCYSLTAVVSEPEMPDVLHHVSFDIKPGEKVTTVCFVTTNNLTNKPQVGILGRTGSGKSTLALSFFRFVEASEGRILIDELDIAQIGLADLRTKLTIIPREQLFPSTYLI
jgi:ABC-type multidrug transport system fused ATPase/permease subunit